jgi:hypothetical protein
LIIRPAFGADGPLPLEIPQTPKGRRRTADQRARLLGLIHAAPRDFVAQERVKLSRAPAWADDQLSARSVVVRAYVANGDKVSAVLPGGLTRVAKTGDELVISMQSGGGSKDTWILGNGAATRPEPSSSLTELRTAEQAMPGIPSRAADHLFWLGRYTERLEQLLRVLRCVLGRVAGEPGGEQSLESQALFELVTNLGLVPTSVAPETSGGELSQRMLSLVYDSNESAGVRELLKRVRFIASTVRDRFSGDTWRILGRLDADARIRPGRLPLASATALIHNLVLDLAAFNGMETSKSPIA